MRVAWYLYASAFLLLTHPAWGQETLKLQALLKQHCVRCHGETDEMAAELNLLELANNTHDMTDPNVLQVLMEVLENREMPPAEEPQPTDLERSNALGALKALFSDSLREHPFTAIPIRRMNRFQYNNAVVDLLELDRDLFQLNERLLRRRSDYFQPASRSMPAEVRVSSRPLSKDIDNQRPEGFRGVAAFPQDQRAEHGFDNRADHLTLSPLLMESFLKLSESIANSPDLNPEECDSWNRFFSKLGENQSAIHAKRLEGEDRERVRTVGERLGAAQKQELAIGGLEWSGGAHLFWQCPQPDTALTVAIHVPDTTQGLKFRFTTARDYGQFQMLLDGKPIGDPLDLYSTDVALVELEFPDLKLNSGNHRISWTCLGKHPDSKGHFFGLDYLELMNPESAKEGKAATHDAEEIRSRIAHLLRRAFRRPPDADTLESLTTFANAQIEAGESVENTMRSVLTAVLAMPQFLYLYEDQSDAATPNLIVGREPITDLELATRLAQFFWSSIPDDLLLDLAEAGELHRPEVLAAEIDRMLDDPKSGRFCDNFPAQWLQLDRLITSIPDPAKFGYFYYDGYRTSMHMMSEPLLLFETVFIEDRSILDFISPDFTWQSGKLAANYEGHGRGGGEHQVQLFRRVPLKDPRRGGVITNAAVMTMTSSPTRTQPITRGAWMNEVIFNDPPEPPPADVPPLPEPNAEELAKLTIRERLSAHRERADCAGCHNQIDPLGFALENYGPTGVWRDEYENGRTVDSAGVLFQQYPFNTVTEFKELIIDHREKFYRAFAAHLLSYGLGRPLGPADAPALDRIAEQARAGKDSLRTLMKLVAMSEPFLRKNTLATHSTLEH